MAPGGQLALTVLASVLLLAVVVWILRGRRWRSYFGPATDGAAGGYGRATEAPHAEKPGGLARWLTTVDHKDIGILYGVFGVVVLFWAGAAAMLMRAELAVPESTLVDPDLYNALMTTHGTTMLLVFGTPILAAFGNYLVPLLVGADDMAFPRINAIAFWLLPPATVLVWAGFFTEPLGIGVEPAKTGWTMYTPLSTQLANPGIDLFLLGLHLIGISGTMGAINFIVTIFAERADDVGWADLDIFSWTMLTQSALVLFAFPVLGSVLVMLLLDRNFGTTFFTVEGGSPLLYQHLFWFFGHPEVYILILPPMGILSLVIPRFAGRKLFGFWFVVYSTVAIGVLSYGVWAHHMFTTGMDPRLRGSFMAVSLAIAVPSAVKTFNWIATMWNGRLRLTAPMLFCIGFVSNFIVGGVTGVFLAAIPVDLIVHDTYYVVGHFHYLFAGGLLFAVFAGIYYWFPLVTGKRYQSKLAKMHFWLMMVGVNATFFAMLLLGYEGMPRRYATYLPRFVGLHQVATLGAFVLGFGMLVFLGNVVVSYFDQPPIEDGDPWSLAEAGLLTNEWAWFRERQEPPLADGGDDAAGEGERSDGGADGPRGDGSASDVAPDESTASDPDPPGEA